MGLRIVLIELPPPDGWHGSHGPFREAAKALRAGGHDVQILDVARMAREPMHPPVLTALNRAVAAAQMVCSHRIANELAAQAPDLIIAPLEGGIAQACLSARACSEAFGHTRIALWANGTSRRRYLAGDAPTADLSPIIADAMERQSLSLADAIILPDANASPPSLPGLTTYPATVICHPINKPPPADPSSVGDPRDRVPRPLAALQRRW